MVQALQKLQDELKLCTDQLHEKEEALKRVLNEKLLLEQKIHRLEKKNSDEVLHFLIKLQTLCLLLRSCREMTNALFCSFRLNS